MQFKLLALPLFAALAVADNTLSSIIDSLPDCCWPCLGSKVKDLGCNTDFGCICEHQVQIMAEMANCVMDACGVHDTGNVNGILNQLCERWNAHPPPDEVAAAQSDFAKKADKPKNAAGSLEPGMAMMGVAAAAAALVV